MSFRLVGRQKTRSRKKEMTTLPLAPATLFVKEVKRVFSWDVQLQEMEDPFEVVFWLQVVRPGHIRATFYADKAEAKMELRQLSHLADDLLALID